MRNPVEIENIEEMRRLQGIDDAELRRDIRALRVGDTVLLTFLSGANASAGETLLVRITARNGRTFAGQLAGRPATPALAKLRVGARFNFTGDHIHSIPKV